MGGNVSIRMASVASIFWTIFIQMSCLRAGLAITSFRGLISTVCGNMSITMASVALIVWTLGKNMIIGGTISTLWRGFRLSSQSSYLFWQRILGSGYSDFWVWSQYIGLFGCQILLFKLAQFFFICNGRLDRQWLILFISSGNMNLFLVPSKSIRSILPIISSFNFSGLVISKK